MTVTDREEEISLADFVLMAIDSRLIDTHTCLPGKVVSYDRATQTAKIQPALKRKYKDGSVVMLPIINKVPIAYPSGKDTFIHWDLEKDDDVILVIAERSLDIWKEKGEVVSPNDPRKFNLSDAYAIPGGKPVPNAFSPKGESGSIEITNKDASFEITKDGIFKLTNGTDELFDLFSQTLTAIQNGTINTQFGPMKFNNLPDFIAIQQKLDAMKG